MISFIRNTFLTSVLLIISFVSIAQEEELNYQDTMTLTEFWTTVMEGDGDSIVELNHVFVTIKDKQEYRDIRKYLSHKRTVNHRIIVSDIYFQDYYADNIRYSLGFSIDSTIFKKHTSISLKKSTSLGVTNCKFLKRGSLSSNGRGTLVRNSEFLDGCDISNKGKGKVQIFNTTIRASWESRIFSNGSIAIQNCVFGNINNTSPDDSVWLVFDSDITALHLESDTFNMPVTFGYNSTISKSVNIVDCQFDKFSIQEVTLPENLSKTYLKWSQIEDKLVFSNQYAIQVSNKIGSWKFKQNYHSFYTDSSITHTPYFDRLKSSANQLYAIYKTQGDMESANQCYADIKEFETRRWKYLYQQDKSFETFFRWQLHNTLSYLSDYGTNPAKAVVKSVWVIFLFAAFYLFFPSDWDVSNKSELLQKIKSLANKNREDSVKSTLRFVAYSGIIHILNALTLSINAFTTLGFGDIPTRGAARYVTIIQGFIGWFFLTVFSVSLISQVLG